MTAQRIAIIGGGIAGMTAASQLHNEFDIQLFETNDYVGGHTHTQDVSIDGINYPVNTGFIVFNDWVYKNFNSLMAPLNVKRLPTEMSFSVSDETTGLEYNGHNLKTLFAQRRNYFSPRFYKMILDILKFNKQSIKDVESDQIDESITLGEYLNRNSYSKTFIAKYIIPMGAAIWSSSESDVLSFPALFFIRFFKNHGLLSVKDRPQWYVIENGSRSYVEPLIEPFQDKIHLNSRIKSVSRTKTNVTLHFSDGTKQLFDQVIFACHSDQALALLGEPTEQEKAILGAIPYQNNEVVLHTDTTLLPKAKEAWAAWNYHLSADKDKPASLTYNMNILQQFNEAPVTFCVTLNRSEEIDPKKIIKSFNYAHPVFTQGSISAQARYEDIGNKNLTHFCGAYWFNGFHEDGVNSAIRVVHDLQNNVISSEIPQATMTEKA